MANFEQAVEWMKEGKKVRLRSWGENVYIYNDGGMIKHSTERIRETFSFFLTYFIATDWEIYKEEDNWNLADCEAPWKNVKGIDDIKTFIQKSRKHMDEFLIGYGLSKSSRKRCLGYLDKRAGDL